MEKTHKIRTSKTRQRFKTGIIPFCAFLLLSGLMSCSKASGIVPSDEIIQVTIKDTLKIDTVINRQNLSTGVVHQKGFQLKTLDVISVSNLTSAQKVLLATLQGIASKTSSEQIYIDEGGPSTIWKNYLHSKYNIEVNTYSSYLTLLEHFQNLIKVNGYILYQFSTNKRSLTVATSLCGPLNAIAVDKTLESAISSIGLNKLYDVSNKTEKWVYTNCPKAFTKINAAELNPEINDHHLRDYIALTNAFTFYDGNSPWRSSVLQTLNDGAYCFGYGQDEFTMVLDASSRGISMLPADLAANLAPLSSIYTTDGLKQRDASSTVTTESNVHYVTFLLSDGDNIGYDLWSLQNYFSNPIRGNFGMGYTISASLYDLAPAALRWYFEKSTLNDYFVCGPSGSSYIFPSKMPVSKLDAYLVNLNKFAGLTGLTICNILDNGALNRMDLWNKYLSQPNINALIYTGYGESPNGSIQFSDNGKPVIEARDNLWQGLEEESTVIANINSRTTNPQSVDGYTLVFVHTWTKGFSNVQSVVKGLNSNVRVVTPDVFVRLIQTNLRK